MVAGALVPGGINYDDGHCWGHIYGPLYCGKQLEPQERNSCFKCLEFFGKHRYLCSYCCKNRPLYEHKYCLSEQCRPLSPV